ncbi:MAG: WG repeat-containing protein [Phaeodactylibacter sp.]|nr:WG repeat-containing protein [Phaeodactylibacter sp.]
MLPGLFGQDYSLPVREAYIPYRVHDKWGYCSPEKALLLPARYDEAGFFQNGYAIVKQDGGYHLADTTGARITERAYSRISYTSGLGYGLLDSVGGVPVYAIPVAGHLQLNTMIREVPDDLALEEERPRSTEVLVRNGVYKEEGKYGFRSGRAIPDPKGGELQYDWDFLIPPKYDSLLVLGPNQLLALEGGKWGMVGPDDNILLEKEYEQISWVALWGSRAYLVKRGGRWGIISRSFQPLMPIRYDTIILNGQLIIAAADGQWGTFNSYGEPLIPLHYDSLFYLFPRQKWFAVKKDGLWGIINEQEKPIYPFQYRAIKNVPGEYLIVQDSLGWGLIDSKNQWVLPAAYDDIRPSVIAGAPQLMGFLLDKEGKTGFFCPEAKKLIPPKYEAFYGFAPNNLAQVKTEKGMGYVSWEGVEYFED